MSLDLPGPFIDDKDIPHSSADFNQIRAACIDLDGYTAGRRMPVFASGAPQRDGDAAIKHSAGDYRIWWGAFRWTTGMDTLTVEGETADYNLLVYLDASLEATITGGSTFSEDIDISAGFTDGQIVTVNIFTSGNPDNDPRDPTDYTSLFRIDDIYAHPIEVASTWPGVPTFSGTFNAARFNQLLDAATYIWDRVRAVPIVPFISTIYTLATHRQETLQMFDGSVGRYAANEVFRVVGTLNCRTNAEHYEIEYGGTTYTSATYTAGQNVAISHPFALTQTLGTRIPVYIRAVVEDDFYIDNAGIFSTYSFTVMRSEADGDGYATATPPSVWTAGESIAVGALNSRLNALATMLDDAKARLDATPELWNRARAARRPFAKDETQHTRNYKRHAMLFQRQGGVLIVRGKGIKIGYGAITVKPPAVKGEQLEPVNWSDFSFAFEQSVGSEGDTVQTHTVMLDSLPGLRPTMLYYVFGPSIEFAAEYVGP